jgi:hypothetical protein
MRDIVRTYESPRAQAAPVPRLSIDDGLAVITHDRPVEVTPRGPLHT